ncbi:MAG: hypothetical protein ACYC6A_06690 [Armatimonadota bacterium]
MMHRLFTICVLLSFLACAVALAADAFDPRDVLNLPARLTIAGGQWEMTDAPQYFAVRVVNDDLLGGNVLEVTRIPATQRGAKPPAAFTFTSTAPVTGTYVAEALVRFIDEPAANARGGAGLKAALSCETLNNAPAYVLEGGTMPSVVNTSRPPAFLSWAGQCGAAKVSGGLSPAVSVSNVSPFSPEMFRLETEAALAAMPQLHNKWIPLRIEVGPKLVRMYCNSVLVTESPRVETAAGPVTLSLRANARVAGLTVRKTDNAPMPYVTVPLDYRCNATGAIDLSAAGPRDRFVAAGVPFMLSSGLTPYDHIDVGASVFRNRFGRGYEGEVRADNHTQAPTQFDPGRIRFNVPARAYIRAWVLAAAEPIPARAPILTLRVYRPSTDWATDASVTVPVYTAKVDNPRLQPVQMKTKAGKPINLWLVPIELDTAKLAAEYRGATLSIELTKEIKPNLAYPDPMNYSYQPGGLPSSVQVYGLTFEEAPVKALAMNEVKGGVYVAPEVPGWKVALTNQTGGNLPVTVKLEVIDPYGNAAPVEQKLTLKPYEAQAPAFQLKTAVNGLHTVRTTVTAGAWSQSAEGAFLIVPPITRKATPLNSPWGVWTWDGAHGTHSNLEDNARLLRALGAINQFNLSASEVRGQPPVNLNDFRAKWGLGPTHFRLVPRGVPAWAAKLPIDPAALAKYAEECGTKTKALKDAHPDFQYVNAFAEDSISLRLTHGIPATAFGQPWFEYDERERTKITQMLAVASAAAAGVKKHAPGVKFILGHCAAGFPSPFFREENWNPDLFDGFGLDLPQFERMPERQPRATEPSLLYFLHKEMKERGLTNKELVHLESYFPSSHPLALGLQGQADNIVRTAVLSLAFGTTKFMHSWTLQDCSDSWGSQHYGGPGLISREPVAEPKPSAAAFATMTRVLDLAKYDGYLNTGSRSAFCLRFKDTDRLIYPVWTVRGSRPLEITPETDGVKLVRIDMHGNEFPLVLENGKASVTLMQTVQWIVARGGGIKSAQVGAPTYTEAPGANRVLLYNFEKADWTYDPQPYQHYAENSWDLVREPAKMTQGRVADAERKSTVWQIAMAERPAGKPCVGFYGVFAPPKPITIPGKAKAIGFYGKGSSQWCRAIYELTDANGEVWLNCGQKNAWNADDIHSRSYFNHDGWRYMEFPLPASSPGDNYREIGMYSWAGSDDGIVDLPLTLNRVIIEMRTDMVYVNDMLPVEDLSIALDDLAAVYETPDDMTANPVKLQAAARNAWRPKIAASVLPNPIKTLAETGAGAPAEIEKVYPPEVMASGDQVYIKIKPVEGAQKYTVYVSAYEDGTGAMPAAGKVDEQDPSLIFVSKLQPAIPMYFFVTCTDKDGKESKPSPARKTVLKDEFPFK